MGACIGAAAIGLRPVADLMVGSFLYVAMGPGRQSGRQAARTCRAVRCTCRSCYSRPSVPSGAAAAQHSENPHPMLMNAGGLKVVMPGTPYDAKGLMLAAMRDPNPVIYFQDAALAGTKGPVPEGPYEVPLGVADVKRSGGDVTVVAIGGARPPGAARRRQAGRRGHRRRDRRPAHARAHGPGHDRRVRPQDGQTGRMRQRAEDVLRGLRDRRLGRRAGLRRPRAPLPCASRGRTHPSRSRPSSSSGFWSASRTSRTQSEPSCATPASLRDEGMAPSTVKPRGGSAPRAGSNARSGQLLVDDLANQIHARMITGEIPVGSWLRQERLAAEYGVSRTPIREAIRKLQASGAVEMVPHRGALVRGPSLRDILESYMVRAELEGFAAELARPFSTMSASRPCAGPRRCSRRRPADSPSSTATRAWRARPATPGSPPTTASISPSSSRPTTVGSCVRSLDLHASFPRSLTAGPLIADPGLLVENIDAHRRIRSALEERDPGEARRAMREHVLRAGDLVVRWFGRYASSDGDLPELPPAPTANRPRGTPARVSQSRAPSTR